METAVIGSMRMISQAFVTLRTLAERASRNVVLRRRMPARFGGQTIFVSPGALLKFWWPNLETADRELLDWATEFIRKDDVVWDVGANVGLFAFAAASIAGPAGQVVAIEPDIWLTSLLRKSACSQPAAHAAVEVLPMAISSSVGIARFNIAMRSRAANYLSIAPGSSQTGGVRETQSVMTVTLDWLLEHYPAPQVVEIDVEGAEEHALKGARRLLSEVRPTVLCEIRANRAQTITELFHSYNYTLFDLRQQPDRVPITTAVFNTLARPDV